MTPGGAVAGIGFESSGLTLKLRRPVADLRVLHEDDPFPLAGIAQPLLVHERLTDALAVHFDHDEDEDEAPASRSASGMIDVPAETAVDEELRRRGGGQLGSRPPPPRRERRSRRDFLEAVAGLEAVDEILDARAAVNDERLTERFTGVHGDLACA